MRTRREFKYQIEDVARVKCSLFESLILFLSETYVWKSFFCITYKITDVV